MPDQTVQQQMDSWPEAPSRTLFPGQVAPDSSLVEYRELPNGRRIPLVAGYFDGAIDADLRALSTALGLNTSELGLLHDTEAAANQLLESLRGVLVDLNTTDAKVLAAILNLITAVVALGPKVDAQTSAVTANSSYLQVLTTIEGTLGIKLDSLVTKEQASVDALTSLVTLMSQNLTAQRNASQSTGFWQGKWTASGGGDVDLGTVAQVDRSVYGLGPSSGSSLTAVLATLIGGMADVQLFHVDPAGTAPEKAFGGAKATILGDPISLNASQPLVWMAFGLTLPAGRQLRAHCNAGNVRLNVRVA